MISSERPRLQVRQGKQGEERSRSRLLFLPCATAFRLFLDSTQSMDEPGMRLRVLAARADLVPASSSDAKSLSRASSIDAGSLIGLNGQLDARTSGCIKNNRIMRPPELPLHRGSSAIATLGPWQKPMRPLCRGPHCLAMEMVEFEKEQRGRRPIFILSLAPFASVGAAWRVYWRSTHCVFLR